MTSTEARPVGGGVGAAGPRRGLVWTALVVVYVVWGSTYLAIRVVVETAPPLLSAGLRFLAAGAVMAAALAVRHHRAGILRVGPRQLGACAVVGALLLLGGNGLVMIAEQRVPSGLAALLIAAVPLWVVVMRLATRDRPRRATVLGVLAGFVGIALLLLPGHGAGHAPLGGLLIVVASSLAWATGSFVSARLPLPGNPLVTTTYEMLAGGVLMTLIGKLSGERLVAHTVSTASWVALGYLVVFGSLLAFTSYVWLLSNAPISLTATYAYVNPAVAVALGALLLGETVTGPMLLGGAIVVGAVAIVVGTEGR